MKDDARAAPAIRVESVSKRFGDVAALDGVSFDVRPGELFFLLGPSGCGKTTMLRILAGLETPDAGRILLNGRDVRDMPAHRRGAPMVFQNYALWPHLSVAGNVAFGLVERRAPRKEIAARVREALARVGLSGLDRRLPGQLSGGQQQRVVLARALVLDPAVMLLDEPLSNLDARLRAGMREEIERLHRETDISFVYVTHDQSEALSLADRVAVMNAGRLRALGAPADLYHRPPNVFCADFLGEANLIAARVTGTSGRFTAVQTPWGAWRAVLAGASAPSAGASVRCLVRPENLRPAGPGPAANRLRAAVRSVRLNGPTIAVRLDADGTALRAALLSRPAPLPAPGAEGEWEAAPDDTVVITEE
ncbi:MAG: ABC transporter ATP-binding protein [Lentisphaerae bacterium]|nr:ABC transporter ATP-binding protein [Lentisphaerota bacterium]